MTAVTNEPLRAAVIGDGAWGTALAMVLDENGAAVTVWGHDEAYLEQLRRTGENQKFLAGVALPPSLRWTGSVADAVTDARLVVLAAPTRYYRAVLARFRGRIAPAADIVSVAKGLDPDSLRRMSELAREELAVPAVACLSGPSHAEEVSRGIPTAVTVAAADPACARRLQAAFSNGHFRVYTSSDPVGVELGGALKNVIAIAVGVSDGMGFGDNTRAALITRGLAEITRLGIALGAEPATFAGLSGLGDLVVTCTSRHSRNRGVGERIGRGENVNDIMAHTEQAVEGVWNCAAALALATRLGIEVPITREVHAMVHEGKNPREAVRSLLARDVRPE